MPATTLAAPTYASLFPEQVADRCSSNALEASDGPVAYLHALYRHALELEAASTSSERLTLAKRRPDIGELVVNLGALEAEVSARALTIEALSRQAQAHVGVNESLPEAISRAHYPTQLPFHLALARINAVLKHKALTPLDLFQQATKNFPYLCSGLLSTEASREATRRATGLNPALHTLLLDTTGASTNDSLQALYGVSGANTAAAVAALSYVETFSQLTRLSADQVLELLAVSGLAEGAAQGFTEVKQSTAYQPAKGGAGVLKGNVYGAVFINNGGTTALSVADVLEGAGIRMKITSATADHFVRIHKIIHLQQALQISFADLDLLVMSAMRAEGQTQDFHFTENTLRALSIFRHFATHYSVTAEQFAALIHQVTPYGMGDTPPFLDRVLDNPGALPTAHLDNSLRVDESRIELSRHAIGEAPPQPDIARLSLVTGQPPQATLATLHTVEQAFGPESLAHSLPVLSALYRLGRLPHWFGLSAGEGLALMTVMSKQNPEVIKQLAGVPRITSNADAADILDILLNMANLVQWLESEKLLPSELLTMITPLSEAPPHVVGVLAPSTRWVNAVKQALPNLESAQLSEEKLNLQLGQPPAGRGQPWLEILSQWLDSQGFVKAFKSAELKSSLQKTLGTLNPKATSNASGYSQTQLDAIERAITNARIAQEDVTKHMLAVAFAPETAEQTFSPEHVLPLLRWVGTAPHNLLADIKAASQADNVDSPETDRPLQRLTLPLWQGLARHAQAVKHFKLTPAGLEALVEHPQWFSLDSTLPLQDAATNDHRQLSSASQPMPPELNPGLCYQISRYRLWIDTCIDNGSDEADALDYLKSTPFGDSTDAFQTAADRLARLLGCAPNEIASAFSPVKALPTTDQTATPDKIATLTTFDEFMDSLSLDEKKLFNQRARHLISYYVEWSDIDEQEGHPPRRALIRKFADFAKANPGPIKVSAKYYEDVRHDYAPFGKYSVSWQTRRDDHPEVKYIYPLPSFVQYTPDGSVQVPTEASTSPQPPEHKPVKPALPLSKRSNYVPDTILHIDFMLRLRELSLKTGLPISLLPGVVALNDSSGYSEFDAAARAMMTNLPAQSLDAIEPELQEQWRAALIAYLLGHWVPAHSGLRASITGEDDLSSYFLTDIRTHTPKTTRIADAIAGLQHYLHRLHAHLEPGYGGGLISEKATFTWQHLERYNRWKTWQAQLNHPENLIYYANRPNKSIAFKELEVELNQGKLDTELLHTAICNYLAKFERISNLQVISGYLDGQDPETDTYHLIGKTNSSPTEYYWRSVDMGLRDDKQRLSPLAWSEWEKIDLPVSGQIAQSRYHDKEITSETTKTSAVDYFCDAVRPVIIAGRRYVFWVERGTIGLPGGADQKPTHYKKLSVHYAFQQADASWSTANEILCLDGTKEGKRATNDDKKNPYLKTDNFLPGLIVFVNTEGARKNDPWLTVLLYDSATVSHDSKKKPIIGEADLDYFVEMRDLLLIDRKSIQEASLKKLATVALASYSNPRNIQHPFDGWQGIEIIQKDAPPEKYNAFVQLSLSNNPTDTLFIFRTPFFIDEEKTVRGKKRLPQLKLYYPDGSFELFEENPKYFCLFDINASDIGSALSIPIKGHGIYKLCLYDSISETESQNYKLKINDTVADEPWNISIHRTERQAQYLKFQGIGTSSTEAPGTLRLNTLFGKQLVARASQSPDSVLSWDTQKLEEPAIDGTDNDPPVDFHGANGRYFRELFLHLPALIATRLTEQGQYRDAEAWYLRYLFDPFRTTPEAEGRPAFWGNRPLAEAGTLGSVMQKAIDPTARAFILSRYYQQAVFLGLVENWQREGDHDYRQLTRSSLTHAWLCYQKALKLIGPLPERIESSRWVPAPLAEVAEEAFRTPINERLSKARQTLEYRLHNLRHGLTIDGKALPAMVWGDTSDPFMYGNGGLSIIANSYNSHSASIPAYRFRQLLPAARSAAQQLLDIGRQYMKLMEDEFNTTLSVLLKAQEIKVSDFTLRLQKESINSVLARKRSLEISKGAAEYRQGHFTRLIDIGRSPMEEAATGLLWTAASSQVLAIPFEIAAATVAGATPNIWGLAVGGNQIDRPIRVTAAALEALSNASGFLAQQLQTEAGYERRAAEWRFELEQTQWTLREIDQQLAETSIELNAATIAFDQAKQERANLEEAYVAMTTGFTIIPIYNWLVARQELLYGAAYDAVLSLCLSLEAAWRYEIGDYQHQAFIKTNAWSDAYKGMLAGESLLVDLQEMENAYLLANERRLSIKKTFSLKQLAGTSAWHEVVQTLTTTKPLSFELKANDFDTQYPGHYLRQLKHVSVSLVFEAGAEISEVCAILTQTGNATLVEADSEAIASFYASAPLAHKAIQRNLRAQQQIALSSAALEDGLGYTAGEWVYELMFHDGRYLPFEGTGAISQWQLEIPDTVFAASLIKDKKPVLKDVQLNLVYTARDGGSALTAAVKDVLMKSGKEVKRRA